MSAPSIQYGSVCSGHCAVTQALSSRGWEPAFFAEVEAFPSAVLGQRFGATAPRAPLDPESVPKNERQGWMANNRELQRIAKRGEFGNSTPNLGDFTKINPAEWANVQWLWGGTPCQDFSVAGLRLGLDGHRGNLTIAFLALAHELAAAGSLRGFTWENVPGILSHKRNAFGCFLAAAVGHDAPIISPHGKGRWPDAGVVVGPRCRLAWIIRDTQHFGLPQRRRRVYVVGCFGDGPDPAEILFERKGVHGFAAPRRGSREDVAPTLSARTRGGGGQGTDFEVDGGLGPVPRLYSAMPMNSGRDFTDREVPVTQPVVAAGPGLGDRGGDYVLSLVMVVSPTITATYGEQSGQDQINGAIVLQPIMHAPDLAATLKAEGFDASEDGTGRQTLVVHQGLPGIAFGGNNTSGPIDVATARSAHAGPHGRLDFETETFVDHEGLSPAAFANSGHGAYVSTDIVGTLRAEGADCHGGSEVLLAFDTTQITSATNRSQPKAGDTGHPLTAAGHPPAIAFNSREDLVSSTEDFGALGSSSPQAQAVAFSVRGRDGEAQIEPEAGNVSPAVRTGTGGSSKSFVASIGHNITWAVRRLLPTECEALQGTARDFTRIRWRGRPEEECPDGPRYKVIGNSMSVDVIIWLGDRIRAAMVAE